MNIDIKIELKMNGALVIPNERQFAQMKKAVVAILDTNTEETAEAPKRAYNKRKKGRRIMGARRYTGQEEGKLLLRYKDLVATNMKKSQVFRELSREFSRTPQAVALKLMKLTTDKFNKPLGGVLDKYEQPQEGVQWAK